MIRRIRSAHRTMVAITTALGLSFGAAHALAQGFWPPEGIPITFDSVSTGSPTALSDGRGGAFVTWIRDPSGRAQVRMLHLLHTAYPDPAWPRGGLPLTPEGVIVRSLPRLSRGTHQDVFVSWMEHFDDNDRTPHVVRVTDGGVLAPGWALGGPALPHYFAWDDTNLPTITDAEGGVYLALSAWWSGDQRVYVFHLGPDGTTVPGWPAGGLRVGAGNHQQGEEELVAAPGGGVYVVWTEVADLGVSSVQVLALEPSGRPTPGWPAATLTVTKGLGNHWDTRGAPDGAGGLFLTWSDLSTGSPALRASHVLADGRVDPAWPENGLVLGDEPGARHEVRGVVSDREGGVFFVWGDMRASPPQCDVYAQHVLVTGSPEPGYPPHGLNLCGIAGMQQNACVAPDGEGGIRVAFRSSPPWWDFFSEGYLLLAGLGLRDGLHAGFPADGLRLSRFCVTEETALTSDQALGSLVVWLDTETSPRQLRAQRVTHEGQPAPGIVGAPRAAATGTRLAPVRQPSRGSLGLRLELDSAARVRMDVFGLDGRRIARLGERDAPAGASSWSWDGRDAHGRPVPPGMLLIRAFGAHVDERTRVAWLGGAAR